MLYRKNQFIKLSLKLVLSYVMSLLRYSLHYAIWIRTDKY
jgi:hypothetical protein